MANQVIELSGPQDLTVSVSNITVQRINLKADDSGDWTIGVQLNASAPPRNVVEGVQLQENHRAGAQVLVTRADIAAHLSITEEAVQEELTISALKVAVTTITVGKVLAAFGLNA